VTPHDFTNPLINLLGVKYILSFDSLPTIDYIKVFQEGKTIVYENKNVLPRIFFVKNTISASGEKDAIEKVYRYRDSLALTAVTEKFFSQNFYQGTAQILTYTPNTISLKTTNNGEGFLILTDIYYPTWHAYIDGKETKIYITDFTFRGIKVPAGNHKVVFEDRLF
jgi:uncharacterized membrane protein YfhO